MYHISFVSLLPDNLVPLVFSLQPSNKETRWGAKNLPFSQQTNPVLFEFSAENNTSFHQLDFRQFILLRAAQHEKKKRGFDDMQSITVPVFQGALTAAPPGLC